MLGERWPFGEERQGEKKWHAAEAQRQMVQPRGLSLFLSATLEAMETLMQDDERSGRLRSEMARVKRYAVARQILEFEGCLDEGRLLGPNEGSNREGCQLQH